MSGSAILRYRVVVVAVVHALLVTAGWLGAWWLRLDTLYLGPVPPHAPDYLGRSLELLPLVLAARLLALAYFGLFQGLWRYVSLTDLVNLGKATVAG